MQADYEQIGWLSGRVAEASATLDGGRTSVDAVRTTVSDFGDTEGASSCRWQYEHLAYNTTLAVERLVAALDSDVARFSQAVAAYQESDRQAADQVLSAGGGTLDVFTAHVHSGGEATDDLVRGQQIDRYIDAVAGAGGPAVATMDANTTLHEDEQRANDMLAPQALGRFGTELGFTDAAAEAGPTHGDRTIDYVFTSPDVENRDADRVSARADELSDHDGQAVDIATPRW